MLKAKQCWNVVSGTKVTCLTCTPGWKVFALRIFLWVLASLMWVMRYAQLALIGASLSEPHIDEFAVEFVYNYILLLSMSRMSCRKSLLALILRVLASFVNSH